MKKGFTLIELLAVIVILAVIALISTPIIIGLIDDARKESFKSSAYGIVKAGEILYSKDMMKGTTEEVTFTYANGKETSIEGKKLEYNGSKPDSGEVKVNEKGEVALAIYNGKHCAKKAYYESEVTISDKSEEECKVFICGEDFLYDSRDKQKYKTTKIGTQCWMAENLRYIGSGCLNREFKSSFPVDSNYGNPPYDACMKATEAELQSNESRREWLQYEVWYQWGAAMNWDGINPSTPEELVGQQGLCPGGWHIPTDAEWVKLTQYVGENPGTKLKATSPAWNGSGIVGFNALPVGYRGTTGNLFYVGTRGILFSSFIYESDVWGRYLESGSSAALRSLTTPDSANSVRCLFGQ